MFNFTKIKKSTRTSLLTLLMTGTLLAQAGTAQTFKFSDFTFTRASATPTNEFHKKVFYRENKIINNQPTLVDVKGVNAFQQFVQKESSAIDLDTLNARKLDSTKLKLKYDKKINIYFIDEGAGYRNQLKLVTTSGTNKDGLVFYDGSKGSGTNELKAGDYVSVGDNLSNNDVVKAGTILDFQLRANGFDTATNTSRSSADVWYTDKSKNVDKLQHVIAYEYQGFLVLAWEDLKNGGDKDYNDIVFAVDIGQANLDAIPDEPPSNRPPSAQDDTGSTNYAAPALVDVLANDSDPDNQAPVLANQGLTITSASSLTGATVKVFNGKVQYTPASDFNVLGGSDSFSYTIKDAQGATGSATVTMSVGAKPTPQNQAPVAKDDEADTPYGEEVLVDVLKNDSDPEDNLENKVLTITSVSSTNAQIVTDPSDGKQKVKYTPTADFNPAGGDDTFSYTITDSKGATATATVTVTVQPKASVTPPLNGEEPEVELPDLIPD
ncbi:MAG: Ig-like domain-containing protein [Waterburya sp.]